MAHYEPTRLVGIEGPWARFDDGSRLPLPRGAKVAPRDPVDRDGLTIPAGWTVGVRSGEYRCGVCFFRGDLKHKVDYQLDRLRTSLLHFVDGVAVPGVADVARQRTLDAEAAFAAAPFAAVEPDVIVESR